MGNEREDTSRG